MKTKITTLFFILLATIGLKAQDVITVEATSYDISDNLDLEAVANLFSESANLEEFEQKLNDPEIQISNLDLNQDGYVDYIRVIETTVDDTYLVTLQAVVGDNLFQDIATIDVEKDESGQPAIQITGDVYLYGDGYIIEPVFVHSPVIFDFFWNPFHKIWFSPYYWRHYPPRFAAWKPYTVPLYHQNLRGYKKANISYHFPTSRRSQVALSLQTKTRRNDYAIIHPERSFDRRNDNVQNKQYLDQKRSSVKSASPRSETIKSTGRTVQKNWSPSSKKTTTQRTQVSKPSSSTQRKAGTTTTRTQTNTTKTNTTPQKSDSGSQQKTTKQRTQVSKTSSSTQRESGTTRTQTNTTKTNTTPQNTTTRTTNTVSSGTQVNSGSSQQQKKVTTSTRKNAEQKAVKRSETKQKRESRKK